MVEIDLVALKYTGTDTGEYSRVQRCLLGFDCWREIAVGLNDPFLTYKICQWDT
jgi:hypothetical protein